jgi:hypothetical protein
MSESRKMPAKRTEDCGLDVRVLIVAVEVCEVASVKKQEASNWRKELNRPDRM